ncbi:MAG: hypothetical protein Q8M93_06425 [Polaromonas sp.]|uniref:hypothetical protein n=1 Tax=Polaromonas sp. TaxID=1869339 RepID=UPI0024882C4F|nr:hypothetical protein [Polaromonas sp.]MDI1268790.1 hypothetical protein [Polaromonas sp.]MDP3246585.1 hypothetical protein [Polaromonas sp.]MDP3757233.1 hypothetical protein [Polaromonas sp.]
MRAIFGVLSLLMVVAIIGVLAKKQLSPAPVKLAPADAGLALPAPAAGATPQQQSQQIQNQMRQSIENAMQQARPMPEDK